MGDADKTAAAATAATDAKVFAREAVKAHNTEKDCWVIIHGKVYDVTKYLDDHPGGPEIIQEIAGQDATEEFEDTGHSPEARETLSKFLVGEAEGGAASKPAASKSSEDGPSFFLILAVLVALLAGAYLMYEPSAQEA